MPKPIFTRGPIVNGVVRSDTLRAAAQVSNTRPGPATLSADQYIDPRSTWTPWFFALTKEEADWRQGGSREGAIFQGNDYLPNEAVKGFWIVPSKIVQKDDRSGYRYEVEPNKAEWIPFGR